MAGQLAGQRMSSGQFHRHEDARRTALHQQGDEVLRILNDRAQVLHVAHRPAVGREHDVTRLDACLSRRTARLLDDEAARRFRVTRFARADRPHSKTEASARGCAVYVPSLSGNATPARTSAVYTPTLTVLARLRLRLASTG